MTTEEYLERRKSKNWRFNKVVEECAFLHVDKVHPLKQRLVMEIVDAAKTDPAVRRIILFGSAIRYDCDITSDLDLCIDWYDDCYDEEGVLKPFTIPMRRVISRASKGHADVINYSDLDDTWVKDAVQKGVLVYEQNV